MKDNNTDKGRKRSYEFLGDGDVPDNFSIGADSKDPSWWGLGNHEESDGIDWDAAEEHLSALEDIDGLGDAVADMRSKSNRTRDSGFECPVCGLSHGHSTDKHDVRDFFGVTEEFADEMMYQCAYCHCGVHELTRLMNYYETIVSNMEERGADYKVFEDQDSKKFNLSNRKRQITQAANSAPIPDDVRTELNESLGRP